MRSGTPSAVPENEPKLDRMSWRTTPLWVSTSGPFDPSPGYGPAVSSGVSVRDAVSVTPAVDDDVAPALEDVPEWQAVARPTTPAPPRRRRAWRRSSGCMPRFQPERR